MTTNPVKPQEGLELKIKPITKDVKGSLVAACAFTFVGGVFTTCAVELAVYDYVQAAIGMGLGGLASGQMAYFACKKVLYITKNQDRTNRVNSMQHND